MTMTDLVEEHALYRENKYNIHKNKKALEWRLTEVVSLFDFMTLTGQSPETGQSTLASV